MSAEVAASVVEVPAPVAVEPATPEAAEAALATQTLDQFDEQQPSRHRARSQRATPEDVPRIAALTKKLRETEAKLAERTAAPVVAEPPAAPVVPRVQPPAAEPPKVVAADKDPEPSEERDPSTGKPYESFTKFVADHGRWAARDEMRTARTAYDAEQAKAVTADREAQLATAWTTNVAAAKAVHADFEAVAYGPSEIPSGSLIDHWVREHPAGPLVLYNLKKNPTELRAMLALPLFEQTEALALLSQRLKPRAAAVTTGAAPTSDVKPVPRPPTPVRTGPMRTEPAAPDPDNISLDAFAEATGYSGRRAR